MPKNSIAENTTRKYERKGMRYGMVEQNGKNTICPNIVNISTLRCQCFLCSVEFVPVSARRWVYTAATLDMQINIKAKICKRSDDTGPNQNCNNHTTWNVHTVTL
jgi:hypothetical protein